MLLGLILGFIAGVAVDILYRAALSKNIKIGLAWFKKKADEVEKNL